MFAKKIYDHRRQTLRAKIGNGLILIPGNLPAPNNYPNNTYYFRQDSTFLYYFGLNAPALFGLVDTDSGEVAIYGDNLTIDDIIWTGPQPTLAEQAEQVGVTRTFPLSELKKHIAPAIARGRRIHYLPPYRSATKLQLSDLLCIELNALHAHKSVDLMLAVAEMREHKEAEEIEQIERSFHIGYEMHRLARRMCRAGVVEREIAGAVEGVAKSMGQGVSFPPIITQHGETLHNLNSDGVLENGRLLLCDMGAEGLSYYCSDHTRTYPIGGKFSARQRDIYNIVLRAHDEAAAMIRPHIMYMDVHRAAQRVLAEGLIGLGLIRGTAEDAVASGAIGGLLMPHGLSHGLGLDVHDCEAMGERSFDFSTIAERAAQSGTCIHRATWRLEPGTVLSDEPGLYFIPALIDKCRAEGKYAGIVDYQALEAYRDFGGIRIEDLVVVTEDGSYMVGGDKHIPVTVEELEEAVIS